MGTPAAFLSNMQFFVVIYSPIRAAMYAISASSAELWVNQDQPILPLINSSFNRTGSDTGRFLAVHTQHWLISYSYFGNSPFFFIIYLHPKMPSLGLGFGIGSPIITAMLI